VRTAEQGSDDADLWSLALLEGRTFVTTEKGFTQYRHSAHYGILVIRLRQPNRLKIHQSVMLALERLQEEEWPGLLVVVRDATMSTSRSGGDARSTP